MWRFALLLMLVAPLVCRAADSDTARQDSEELDTRTSATTSSLANVALSAFLQVAVLAGVPFLVYFAYQRWRHKRSLSEVSKRAGLQQCSWPFLAISAGFVLIVILLVVLWPPRIEPLTRSGSPLLAFVGLGLTIPTIAHAILYGAVQTAFAEELLFRGLIAGSLARRLPFLWANLVQAIIFFLPHLLILLFAAEVWFVLPFVFIGALFFGWMRIRSGSIIGPWLMHATGNMTMALLVAVKTSA